MRLIVILLYCYIVIFCFGQLTRFSLAPFEITLHLADIFVGLLVMTWLVWKLIKREKFIFPSLSKQILLFFLLAFFLLVINSADFLSGREMIVSWLYLFRWIFYAGLYFLIYDLVLKKKEWCLKLQDWLIGIGLTSAILGLFQYFLLPDTRFLEEFGWDPHYYRLIGTFLDPGFLGLIFVFTLILLTLKLWSARKKWQVVMWVIVYLALALTYSRASYLAYLGGMGVIAYFKKAPQFFLGILVALVITVFLLPRPGGEGVRLERESTIKFRLINWQQSLVVARDRWLFGVGFNAYRYAQRDYGFLEFANWRASHAGGGADSSFLFTLATTGVFGLAAYLWIWVKIFKVKNVLVLATAAAMIIHSFFSNSLFYPWIMAWGWILLGSVEAKEKKLS